MNPDKYQLIVTSGPTREWIDPVRFISNPSSGQTGYQIAMHGIQLFAQTTYICGTVCSEFKTVKGARNISVESTKEMGEAVRGSIHENTILIMAAAPADYTIRNTESYKIKKEETQSISLELVATEDILMSLIPFHYENFYKVGFAAETHNVLEYAKGKLQRKKLNYICANEVHKEISGFGTNMNTLHVIDKNLHTKTLGPATKTELASSLIHFLMEKIN